MNNSLLLKCVAVVGNVVARAQGAKDWTSTPISELFEHLLSAK